MLIRSPFWPLPLLVGKESSTHGKKEEYRAKTRLARTENVTSISDEKDILMDSKNVW